MSDRMLFCELVEEKEGGKSKPAMSKGNGSARSSNVGREHSFQMAVTELSGAGRRCRVRRFHVL